VELAPTKFALLRHDRQWPSVTLQRLAVEEDGRISLVRLPGLRPAVSLPGPFSVAASGLVSIGGDVYLADADGILVWREGTCARRWELAITGSPRGVVAGDADLFVAVHGPPHVLVVRRDTFQPRAVWTLGLVAPESLALDVHGRLYVVDRGTAKVVRVSPGGWPDAGFSPVVHDPRFVAVDENGTVYVSDALDERILRFDAGGAALPAVPAMGGPASPRALQLHGGRLYCADASDGSIHALDLASETWMGTAPGFAGPCSALAASSAGDLHVKTDDHQAVLVLGARVGRARSGLLSSGPHDAGVSLAWRRLAATLEGDGGDSLLRVALLETSAPPSPGDWSPLASLDTLLPAPGSAASPGRWAWVEIELSGDGYHSPALAQLSLETPQPSWLEHLPPIYARRDDGTLERWLALFQSELGDMERVIDALSRRFDATQVPPEALSELESWLAWRSPLRASDDQRRALLQQAFAIHARRGTPRGIREAVERETGIVPTLVPEHGARRLWVLGASKLGLESGIAPRHPNGAVVPDPDSAGSPPMIVGQMTVGQTGPQAREDFAENLFTDTAHLFSVLLPAGSVRNTAQYELVRDVVRAERPAHTDFHLCAIQPRMRVGFQARIGIDAIVAGPRPAMVLGTQLGVSSVLGGVPSSEGPVRVGTFAVGRGARIGRGAAQERNRG
jgi:phage tail-like protein